MKAAAEKIGDKGRGRTGRDIASGRKVLSVSEDEKEDQV
jgi:hypothetical protein